MFCNTFPYFDALVFSSLLLDTAARCGWFQLEIETSIFGKYNIRDFRHRLSQVTIVKF